MEGLGSSGSKVALFGKRVSCSSELNSVAMLVTNHFASRRAVPNQGVTPMRFYASRVRSYLRFFCAASNRLRAGSRPSDSKAFHETP